MEARTDVRTGARITGRLRAFLTKVPEEDGVFRPVRMPLWIDLGISLSIVVAVASGFVGFFVWLAPHPGLTRG